jgi:glycosyltransferase involved in cell wall biosynthesis
VRIVYITAGAAGMYCGTCFRDNTLATELIARGHDVLLVPLYTPTLTDEPNVSQKRVFFGGISVYLQQHSSLFRHTPWIVDRLWEAPPLLKAASKRSIAVDPKMLGELTISMLKGEEGNQRKELAKLLHWLRTEVPPDIVALQSSLFVGLAGPIRRALGVPVCCMLAGEDLFLDGLPPRYRDEALALIRQHAGGVDCFVAVSDFYRTAMAARLGIPRDRIDVAPLGISVTGLDPAPRPRGGVFTVGYFARVAPEKGLHVLADAYRLLRERTKGQAARLEAAGYLGPEHRGYLAAIEAQMREWGLAGEFTYRGAPERSEKIAFLRRADVFSVPATYDEPKGMSVLEAMACGVPVVQPRRGTFVEIVEKTGGGLLVPPDDPARLAGALHDVWRDPAGAAAMGGRGARGVRQHFHAGVMAERVLATFERVRAGERGGVLV